MGKLDPNPLWQVAGEPRRLTAPELVHVGTLRFGPDWPEPMARELSVPIRRIRRWKAGEIEIEPWAGPTLVDVLERDGKRMMAAARELRAALGLGPRATDD
jgi:hypothetical protein